MSQRFGKMMGRTVVWLCILALALGMALLGKAQTMPAHVDEHKAQELTEIYDWGHFTMSPQEREQRESEIAGLRTAKWLLYNTGVCFSLAGATLAVAIVRFRLWDMRNLKTATTPRTRMRLIVLASAAWLALIPAFFLDLHDEYGQDDLMPHSGVAPGIFWVSVVPTIIVIWILATLICRFVILRKAKLPARLWGVDHKRTYRSVGLTSLYGVMIGLLAVFTVLSAVYFKWGIPSELLGIYVLLSSRAALLNRDSSPVGG